MTIPNIVCDDLTVKHVTVTSLFNSLMTIPNIVCDDVTKTCDCNFSGLTA